MTVLVHTKYVPVLNIFLKAAKNAILHHIAQNLAIVHTCHLQLTSSSKLSCPMMYQKVRVSVFQWNSWNLDLYTTSTRSYTWHTLYLCVQVQYRAFLLWKADTLNFWYILGHNNLIEDVNCIWRVCVPTTFHTVHTYTLYDLCKYKDITGESLYIAGTYYVHTVHTKPQLQMQAFVDYAVMKTCRRVVLCLSSLMSWMMMRGMTIPA